MNGLPEPDLPSRGVVLPEGCSDLIDAYKIRAASEEEHRRFIRRMAARLHDQFLAQLDPEVLRLRNKELLLKRISDFLHPILLANPKFEKQLGGSSNLVQALFDAVMAPRKLRRRFTLRIAAMLHDAFVAQLDPEVLRTRNEELLVRCISDFVRPILLENPILEWQLGGSSELVDTLLIVVLANAGDGKS